MLGVLKPANAILQSQTVDVCKAGEVVSAFLESLKAICRDEVQTCGDDVHPSKRRRTLNKQLDDSMGCPQWGILFVKILKYPKSVFEEVLAFHS